jgi:hypothetical protein
MELFHILLKNIFFSICYLLRDKTVGNGLYYCLKDNLLSAKVLPEIPILWLT